MGDARRGAAAVPLMTTGRQAGGSSPSDSARAIPLDEFMATVKSVDGRVPGTAVFMTRSRPERHGACGTISATTRCCTRT